MDECKDKDMTYAAPLFVTAEFINNNTGEIKSQTVFMGGFPMMPNIASANMAMPGMPTVVAGLPGFEAFASYMMKKEMDKLDIPHVTEFIEMIDAAGGEIYACKLAADMFHLKKEDFLPEVKDIITVGDMYALADGEGTQIVFV